MNCPLRRRLSDAIRPKLVLEIGRDLLTDDFVLMRVRHVAAALDRRIYVLDAGEPDVKVFTAAGRYVCSTGRSGAGPGEFTHPGSLRLKDKSVIVGDFMQGRSITFALEGKHLATRRYRTAAAHAPGQMVHELRGGSALLIMAPNITNRRDSEIVDFYAKIVFKPAADTSADTLLRIRGNIALRRRKNAWISNMMNAGVGDGGAWALHGDSILALVDGYSGDIRWLRLTGNSATVFRTAKLPGTAQPVTQQDIARAERQLRREVPAYENIAFDISDFPSHRSLASTAVFADDGSLWVAPHRTDAVITAWTVYPRSSGRSFVVLMPSTFTLSSIRDGRLYGYAMSSDETPVVQVYRMPDT